MAKQLDDSIKYEKPGDWDSEVPEFKESDGPMATRDAGSKVLNAIAKKIPWLMGGSGDLAPSTKTLIKDEGYFEAGQYQNRNIAWGIREHCMCAASSGLALHGGIRPYAATFFIFTDYARPAIRLSAIMNVPVIYVMTHDSIGLGEDGPTHQPIEHLASLRAMPNMTIIRPCDANETAWAWRAAIMHIDGPVILVLTRQKLPIFDRGRVESAEGVINGAYILSKELGKEPDVILIASGSEVQLILDAQEKLIEEGIDARVVSMPSWELFRLQGKEYIESVLPSNCKRRLAVEAGSELGWCEWVGDEGDVLGMTRFGASAPAKDLFKYFGFTVEHVIEKATALIRK
jgi:transketolase